METLFIMPETALQKFISNLNTVTTEGQAVSQKKTPLKIYIFLKILWQLFESILGQSESLFGLSLLNQPSVVEN